MTLAASQWETALKEKSDLDQNVNWWDECYVPSPADIPLRGVARSVIVVGGPGSGKTVAIDAFERQEKDRLFIYRYPPDRWYGEANAWLDTTNHLSQIMAGISIAIKEFLVHHPHKLESLTSFNLEYLHWVIKKYSDKLVEKQSNESIENQRKKKRRAFLRWVDALNHQPFNTLVQKPFDDIYPSVTDQDDVQGQLEELVTLSRRFDFAGVTVLVDLNEADMDDPVRLEKMVKLFSWLTPLQVDGFAIKAAVPESAYKQTDLITKSRDRASFTFLRWSLDDCYQLVNKYLAVATNHQIQALTNIAEDELITRLANQLQNLYGFYTPKIWLELGQILISYVKIDKKLTLKQLDDILHAYYANHIPLKFDKNKQGVWREKTFIKLDPKPFGFFEILWRYRNSLDDPDRALFKFAGKRGNINTLASRLRNKIEPVPKQPVYVKNDRIRGYWLENVEEFER